jgi:hypothetical protein
MATLRDDLTALAAECQAEGEKPCSSHAWKSAHLGFAEKLRALLETHPVRTPVPAELDHALHQLLLADPKQESASLQAMNAASDLYLQLLAQPIVDPELLDHIRASLPKCEMTDSDDDDAPKCGEPAFGKVENWDACDRHREGQGYHWDTALAPQLRALLGVKQP